MCQELCLNLRSKRKKQFAQQGAVDLKSSAPEPAHDNVRHLTVTGHYLLNLNRSQICHTFELIPYLRSKSLMVVEIYFLRLQQSE